MNWTFFRNAIVVTLIVAMLYGFKDNVMVLEHSGEGPSSDEIVQLVVNTRETGIKIQPTMYGIFFEDINFAGDGGLYPELVKNRGFEFDEPLMGWIQPNSSKHSLNLNSGISTIIKTSKSKANRNFNRVLVNDPSGYELINVGFRGMGIVKDAEYRLTFSAARGEGDITKVKFALIDSKGKVLGETSVFPDAEEWKNYETTLVAQKTEAKARLRISFEGRGTLDMDMISLFPVDTWNKRKNGLRKDLVQLLYDMNPGFLRFPGGCIVEGRTLAKRYKWKTTVGPLEERQMLVNRWNTEFKHRRTPDYFQSFGLGFFEYFQLAEDLGAEPMPILGCGMACQFNTGELVPMDELDPYVQEALDLIEFANGDIDTPWGKVRSEMGHPEPFNMTYLGIGNEQWGPEYINRYKVFAKAIKEKYPEIIIISGSGPFPDGEHFEYGWKELKKLNAEIVDEHYYRPPSWFRDNADRYDSYDRSGPKVFAGEYAAQSVAIASPDNKNNWECALSEAAFLTGLERNADVVVMTSYAPLMAHTEGWQWTPDMIWFNNLESIGTANYQVQKMFSTNAGKELQSISKNGKPLTGQGGLYASAVKDVGVTIIKLVNTSHEMQRVGIRTDGQQKPVKAKAQLLASDDLEAMNSFDDPMKISPKNKQVNIEKRDVKVDLEPYSLTVVKVVFD